MTGIKRVLVVALSATLMIGSVASAQDQQATEAPPPFPQFSPHRVAAPPPGFTGPRITVQIGVPATETSNSVPEVSRIPDAGTGATEWFWDAIPSGRDQGAGRFQDAMQLLSRAPEADGLPVMRVEALSTLANTYGTRLLQTTVGTRVSPALALAVMAVESHGNVQARSSAGAEGLMQLIPATAERFGVENAFDPGQSIAGGVAYLDWLLERFDGDPILALAAYNAGEGAVRNAGGVPDIAETRQYVPLVLATWATTRLLCLTPPELVSDGCVFRSMEIVDR